MALDDAQILALFGVFVGFGFFAVVRNAIIGSIALFCSLLFIRILYEPVYFPDFVGYYFYHLALSANGVGFYGGFEILSKALFVYAGELMPSIDSLTAVHWVVFCLSFSIFLIAFLMAKLDKLALLLMLALIGPIVLLVTMRASIAYALVTLFIVRGARFRSWDVLLLLVTPAIHISVLLVIVPLVVYHTIRRARVSYHTVFRWTLVLIFVGASLKLAALILPVYSLMLSLATSVIPNLAKYDVYISAQISFFHHIYYFAISALIMTCFHFRKLVNLDIRLLMIMSWVFFLLGPVAVVAFRYSLFFVIPLIMTSSMPKHLKNNLPFQFIFATVCSGIFSIHLLTLYDVYF